MEETQTLTLHNSKIKFRDLSEDQIQEVKRVFNAMVIQAGVNQPLEEWAVNDIINFIRIEFKDFSFSEIREAFLKLNANKLDFKDKAYQNFSQSFLGDVLTSYRSYRNKALFKYHKELEKLEEEREPTPEELEAIEQDFLNNCLYKPYEKALKNGTDLVFEDKTAASIMLKMLKKGKISVTKEEIDFFRSKAKESLKRSLRSQINGKNQKSIKNLIDKLELEEVGSDQERRIKERAAKYFLEDYFTMCVDIQKPVEEVKI